MSVAEKLTTIAENEQKVYEAGKQTEYDAFWNACQNYGNRTNYIYGFAGASWNNKTLNLKYAIAITGTRGENMFLRCNCTGDTRLDMTEVCKKLDASQATSGKEMFRDAYLENVTIDLGNATTIANCFNSGNSAAHAIKNVTLKVTEKCTAFTTAFSYCRETEEVIFTEDSVIAANGLNLQWSDKLSKASVISVVNALSTTTTGLTVTLSKTAVNNAFETSTEAADGSTSKEWADLIATKPNWTISLV